MVNSFGHLFFGGGGGRACTVSGMPPPGDKWPIPVALTVPLAARSFCLPVDK